MRSSYRKMSLPRMRRHQAPAAVLKGNDKTKPSTTSKQNPTTTMTTLLRNLAQDTPRRVVPRRMLRPPGSPFATLSQIALMIQTWTSSQPRTPNLTNMGQSCSDQMCKQPTSVNVTRESVRKTLAAASSHVKASVKAVVRTSTTSA